MLLLTGDSLFDVTSEMMEGSGKADVRQRASRLNAVPNRDAPTNVTAVELAEQPTALTKVI